MNFTPCFLPPLCSYVLFNYFLHTDLSPALLPQTISTVLSTIPKTQQLLSSVYCSLTCPTLPTGYRVAQKILLFLFLPLVPTSLLSLPVLSYSPKSVIIIKQISRVFRTDTRPTDLKVLALHSQVQIQAMSLNFVLMGF